LLLMVLAARPTLAEVPLADLSSPTLTEWAAEFTRRRLPRVFHENYPLSLRRS
jgi:hypothetical protein